MELVAERMVSRIKRLSKFVAGAKCFLPFSRDAEPEAFCEGVVADVNDSLHRGSPVFSLSLSPSVVKRNFNHILRD